ncbi:MAG: putative DNA binding domain-containing protein [Deltaproteobacteria bacterium]|nr:putative DNA binding domain-containing protein [Deltaproteobacteria bacterium]
MTTTSIPTTIGQVAALVKRGEGATLEFKRSTGELKEGMRTLCAFLNGTGGTVLFGVRPEGTAEGQDVSDKTLRDIAQAADRFEPPAHVSIERIKGKEGREIVVVTAEGGRDGRPFTYEGHPYERVGSTTRRMPQAKYERLLVERGHAKRRWENLPAEGLALKDLDSKEILRTRDLAIQQNRISPETSRDIGEILDRLGLRIDGVLTQAAQVLYGTRFLPYYTQCLLKMGRFRGTEVTGEIVDNRQDHMHAFAMVREGMAFLERTMPLGARFPKGKIFREDRFPIPMDALREILLNAVMHRDYSHGSGYVAIAVFDDRIEIISYGRLPTGITVKQLSGKHDSKPVNPLIAGAFHRTGAVEVWGRGTNRVIAACKRHGIKPPKFKERQGFVAVTFNAEMVAGNAARPESQPESRPESQPESLALRVLASLEQEALSKAEISTRLGQKEVSGQLNKVIRALIGRGHIEYTLPDKPNSRLQKYRMTPAGEKTLKKPGGEDVK